jgi:hypothetical protein
MNGHLYIHEDVFIEPHRADAYLANQGSTWVFSEECRHDLLGIFAQLRVEGTWPRAVNLWEADWSRMVQAVTEQFGSSAQDAATFEEWWNRSLSDRTGGFDRWLRPAPDSPALADLARGPRRPCTVQQVWQVRPGAVDELLAWSGGAQAPAAEKSGWQPGVRLAALHSASAYIYWHAESWDGLLDLANALPLPDPAWHAHLDTSCLQAWDNSLYLARGRPG